MSVRPRKTLHVAMAAWEIGRVSSGFGAKIGGLGTVMEELPEELIQAAADNDLKLSIDLLSPCFGHYDQSALAWIGTTPITLDGHVFDFHIFRREIAPGLRAVYFWDQWQLGWTSPAAIYPEDPIVGCRLYAAVSQAMAGYISDQNFDTLHSHDYHVGLIPFYLSEEEQQRLPVHLTIHNATHQGICPLPGDPYEMLFSLNLDGYRLYHEFFDFYDNLNLLKAAVLKTHRSGGRVTTVSGDLGANWGYAAELQEGEASLRTRAGQQKWWGAVGEIFLPNRHLNVLEQIPIAGITNGLSSQNWPQNLPQLRADYLSKLAKRRRSGLGLENPEVEAALLLEDHTFNRDDLHIKAKLKRLLHLEVFGTEPIDDPILLTVVGRLVDQKNLGLVAAVAERILSYDPGAKFVILASAADAAGRVAEEQFRRLAAAHPERFRFIQAFNEVLGKLIQAGGDFMLIPSRFEPCGLVDYEASLLGTVVVGHRTGGLAKVNECAYLYDWLDISDYWGEAHTFAEQIEWAIRTYRDEPDAHRARMLRGMKLDASWTRSAETYLDLYRYGLLVQEWRRRLTGVAERFRDGLEDERELFEKFIQPTGLLYRNLQDVPIRRLLKEGNV